MYGVNMGIIIAARSPGVHQPVYFQGVEEIGHRGCAALGGEQIKDPLGRNLPAAHLLGQIFTDYDFVVFEHSVRGWIMIADD